MSTSFESVESASLRVDAGRTELWIAGKAVLRDLSVRAFGETWAAQAFQLGEPGVATGKGTDGFGDFVEQRWTGPSVPRALAPDSPPSAAAFELGLRIRFYPQKGLAACWLLYGGGEALKADGAAVISMPVLEGFAEGMAAWRNTSWWTQPKVVDDPNKIPAPCQHLLWRRADGTYGVLLPLGGQGAKASLGAFKDVFGLNLASGAPGLKAAEIPAFVVGLGEDCFALNESVFALAAHSMGGSFAGRKSKPFPEIFEGIGWCSWNTYYYHVNEAKLVATAESFAKAGFPIKYFLIDDGWSQLKEDPSRPQHPDKPWDGTATMLWDFPADPAKFPNGLKGALEKVKAVCGVEKLGVWHAFLGYWSYVHPQSPLAKAMGDTLIQGTGGGLVPDPRQGKALRFYREWYRYLAAEGVSFLKVDDQSSAQFAYRGVLPLQEAAQGLENALQTAVAENFKGALINCMAMSWENVSAMDRSNVIRSSNDFLPNIPENAPQHLISNIYNSFWIGCVATPDFDMFESHHAKGQNHALLRALSGGPVYFTDRPGEEQWDLLWKLVTADGRLLRADQPALPTRDSMFWEPLERPQPLKCFTRMGDAGAIGLFNVYRANESISASLKPSDVEGIQGRRFLDYEHFSGRAVVLERDEAMTTRLDVDGKELHLLVPMEEGFAAAGLLDKFLAPRAVESVRHGKGVVQVRLRESGRFGFYSESPVASVDFGGVPARVVSGPGHWYVAAPDAKPAGPCDVRIQLGAAR
ncbi:MAG TPA: Sip1-related alpha-galactosidase [bacterium]|jgi:raffinose synthase|nr:Sip1-related alpha-galactosidase [bacterium]